MIVQSYILKADFAFKSLKYNLLQHILYNILYNIYTTHTLNEESNACICNKNNANGMNMLFTINVSISLTDRPDLLIYN